MAISANLGIIGTKIEGAPGTAETITNAEVNVRVYDLKISPAFTSDDEDSKYLNGHHGEDVSVVVNRLITVSFSTKMNYGGAATTEPKYWKLLNGCGAVKETYTTTGISLQPQHCGDISPITMRIDMKDIDCAQESRSFTIAGCMGNATIQASVGGVWKINYTFSGKLTAFADVETALVEGTMDTTQALPFTGYTISLLGKTSYVSDFQLDFGNEVSPLYDQSDASGVKYYYITNRKPRLTVNPIAEIEATDGVYTAILGSTVAASSVGDATNKLNILMPKTQILTGNGLEVRDGAFAHNLNIKLLGGGSVSPALDSEVTWEILQGARA